MTDTEQHIFKPGTVLGNYEIIEFVSQGGMGMIYRAIHKVMKREGALKVLYPHLTADKDFVARFRREAQAMAQLRHPHIAEVYDAGEANGYHYLSMEYFPSGSLQTLLLKSRQSNQYLPVTEALKVTRQMALALDYAHGKHFVHRDIKPSNILVATDGRYVLTDFGIVLTLGATRLTKGVSVMGTPEYMSPEEAQGLSVDGRSDLYSLGIVLYEMLAGTPPFTGDTPWSIIYKQVNDSPRPLGKLRKDLPAGVRTVVERAIAKRPEDRFQYASELISAIDATVLSKPVKRNRNPMPAIVGTGAAVILVSAMSLASYAVLHVTPTPDTVTPLPCPTPLMTPTATRIRRTATYTATPAPTQTSGVADTATPISTPISTPTEIQPTPSSTLPPTATPRPTQTRAPTNTPVVPGVAFNAPALISPPSGSDFQLPTIPKLTWSSVGTLDPDEYYFVEIVHSQGIDPYYVQATSVSPKDYLPSLSQNKPLSWRVTVVRKTSQGGYTPISPPSETWSFIWRTAGSNTSGGGGGSVAPTIAPP